MNLYYYVGLLFMTHFHEPALYCSGQFLIATVNTVNKDYYYYYYYYFIMSQDQNNELH